MQQRNEDWVAKVEAPPTWWEGAPKFWPVSYLWTKEEISSRDWRQQLERARAEQRQQLGENYDPQVFDSGRQQARDPRGTDRPARAEDGLRPRRRRGERRAGRATRSSRCRCSRSTASSARSATRSRSLRRTSRAKGFENEVRDGLAVETLPRGLNDSAFVTNSEMDRLLKLLAEERSVAWVQLPAPAPDNGPVSGKEIDTYWAAHRNEFRAPETGDDRIRRHRRQRTHRAGGGRSRRCASASRRKRPAWAVVANASSRTSWSRCRPTPIPPRSKPPKRRRRSSRREAKAPGADFAALAAANSDDGLSKTKGGDLGWVAKGVMEKPFEDAVFAMQGGQVEGPVRTQFGWHVLQVREVKGASEAQLRRRACATCDRTGRRRSRTRRSTTSPPRSWTWSTRIRPRSIRPRRLRA